MKTVFFVPFGADFLEELHQFIIEDGKELPGLAIVFAGKRPALYLKKRFGEAAEKPIYGPRFFSIEEFVDFIVRKQHPDFPDIEYADAIWLLYQCIQSLPSFSDHPFRKKGFGDFFWWGRYLLEFINQLDSENIDNPRLRSLEKNAELGYDVPENTNELLTHVTDLRNAFHAMLRENRSFTKGYKKLCASQYITQSIPDDFEKVYFAGLFALNNTEKTIIQRILAAGKCDIVLDGNPAQWPILSGFISFLGADTQSLVGEPIKQSKHREITIHAGIDTHSQCLRTYEILKDLSSQKAVVVLPSSETLFPLLSFAVDRIDRPYNISLGYPLSRTSLFDLVVHVLNAHARKRKDGHYPATEYLSIMLHPFTKNLEMETAVRPTLASLEKLFTEDVPTNTIANKPFVTLGEIEEALFQGQADDNFRKIHDTFFRSFEAAGTLSEYCQLLGNLLEFILRHTPLRSFILSGEIFRELYGGLEKLKNTLFGTSFLHNNDGENRRIICDFIREHLKSIRIPFETKPVEDLEIIGVLESRNIAFDTVIMLDVNEGIIPQAKKINPLIPLGIYDILGIPSTEFNEEIFRYYFYRLIRSARHVHLIYTDSEEMPRSRYIEQLIWEQESSTGTLNKVSVHKLTQKINVHRPDTEPLIEKTEYVLNALREKAYSPSVIDDYIACPVLFFHRHVLRFDEAKGIREDIDASDRGKIIHSILNDTFNGYLNREISSQSYEELLIKVRAAVAKHFGKSDISGDYYLFQKLAAFKLESFLRKHVKETETPFFIKHLETKIEEVLDINRYRIRMKGRIDRVDYFPQNNTYMIIDYKTGGGTSQYPRSSLKHVNFLSMDDIRKYINSFQLPIYLYLFTKRFDIPIADVNAKLVLLKNNTEEMLFRDNESGEKETIFTHYMNGVATVIKDILDPAKPFGPFDTDSCETCTFRSLCHM